MMENSLRISSQHDMNNHSLGITGDPARFAAG